MIVFELIVSFILSTDGWLDLQRMTSGLDHLTQRDKKKKIFSSQMTYRMKQLSLSGIKIVVILTKQSGTRLLCFFAFLAVFTEAVPIAMQNGFFFLMQFYMRLCDDSHVLVNNC